MDDVAAAVAALVLLLAAWRGPLWRARPLPGVTRARPLRVGHRGVRGSLPENTMVAFRRALDSGLDGIETDVQRTADGVLVLVHDEVVQGRRVTETTRNDLAELVPDLATLEALVALMREAPGTLLNVELKNGAVRDHGLARAVARALRTSGIEDRVLVSSFNPLALLRLRLAAPHLRTAYLWISRPETPRWLRTPWPAPWLHVDALHPHHALVDDALLAWAARHGLSVNVWTVNEPADIQRLVSLGVAACMSDDPHVVLSATGGRRP
jgi:glycerophosphoryl diester phosphodiesterase